jgi:hypothetical protein
MSMISSHLSGGNSSAGAQEEIAALATIASRRGNSASVSALVGYAHQPYCATKGVGCGPS